MKLIAALLCHSLCFALSLCYSAAKVSSNSCNFVIHLHVPVSRDLIVQIVVQYMLLECRDISFIDGKSLLLEESNKLFLFLKVCRITVISSCLNTLENDILLSVCQRIPFFCVDCRPYRVYQVVCQSDGLLYLIEFSALYRTKRVVLSDNSSCLKIQIQL